MEHCIFSCHDWDPTTYQVFLSCSLVVIFSLHPSSNSWKPGVNITPENNPALVIQLLNDQIHGFEPQSGSHISQIPESNSL